MKTLTMFSMLIVMMMLVMMMMVLAIVGKCRAMSASLRSDSCNCDYQSFNEKLCLKLRLVMMLMMMGMMTRSLTTMMLGTHDDEVTDDDDWTLEVETKSE